MSCTILKYICDENNTIITNENGWPLCLVQFDDGTTDLQYIHVEEEQEELQNENTIDLTGDSQIFDPNEPSTSYAQNDNLKLIWTDGATKYLLEKYQQKFSFIGPLKPYKYKREMWAAIAKELEEEEELSFKCTGTQCENHYKSIMRAYHDQKKKNKTSGNTRHNVKWESEINAIKALDDSIDPEILVGVGKEKMLEKHSKQTEIKEKRNKKKTKEMKSIDIWFKAFKKREKNKERRHLEKMKFLLQLKKGDYSLNFQRKKTKKNTSSSSSDESSDSSTS